MTNKLLSVTPFPEVNNLLAVLLPEVHKVLGSQLLGFYLDGSLCYGGFDEDSDIDFVAVTSQPVADAGFEALHSMHQRLARYENRLADQLEGTYISAAALRRHDPATARHPNLERGAGEQLKYVQLDASWNVHRYFLREHGLTLFGPPPADWVDPVSPAMLRQAMQPMLAGWLPSIAANPAILSTRGYQSYIVLTLCRILYTYTHGTVVSKPQALAWAQTALPRTWTGLLDDAWVGRHQSGGRPEPVPLAQTVEFIRYTLAVCANDRQITGKE